MWSLFTRVTFKPVYLGDIQASLNCNLQPWSLISLVWKGTLHLVKLENTFERWTIRCCPRNLDATVITPVTRRPRIYSLYRGWQHWSFCQNQNLKLKPKGGPTNWSSLSSHFIIKSSLPNLEFLHPRRSIGTFNNFLNCFSWAMSLYSPRFLQCPHKKLKVF